MTLKPIAVLFVLALLPACSRGASRDTAADTDTMEDDEVSGPEDGFVLAARVRRVPPRIVKFDRNHDGVLERDEVPARLQGWFQRVDANHDGIVTAQEIRASHRAQRHHAAPVTPEGQGAGQGAPGVAL